MKKIVLAKEVTSLIANASINYVIGQCVSTMLPPQAKLIGKVSVAVGTFAMGALTAQIIDREVDRYFEDSFESYREAKKETEKN